MSNKQIYGLVISTIALALVVCAVINQQQEDDSVLFQQPSSATMLKTEHWVAPNPFEDPELRKKYDVKVDDETAKSKKDFQAARDSIKQGMGIMKAVLKDLNAQDEKRDGLMDNAITISDRIHRVRHLLINIKAEALGIQTLEDGNWIFTNPFGKDADPPQQDVAPFEKQVKDLSAKCDKINHDLKDLIKKTQSARNDAIVLDSKLYGQIQKAKHIAEDAVVQIHHHNDKVEDFNGKDYDVVHRVDAKLNDKFRIDRHRLHGMFNLANAMSARQPNEVSEVTALCTDLLIVNAETLDRLHRMQALIDNIKYERDYRTKN